MADDGELPDGTGDNNIENSSPDRRELVRKLATAAILPVVVATFVASDLTDAAASP